MKERTVVGVIVAILFILVAIGLTKSTDMLFVAAALGFFAICVGYAELCERL